MKKVHLTFLSLLLGCLSSPASAATEDGRHKLVLIAGSPSHPPLMHEFRAGTLLLEKWLANVPGLLVDRHDNGWVTDEKSFEDADAIVVFSDGGPKHPFVVEGRLAKLQPLIDRGVGFGCMHYGVEVVPEAAGNEFKQWLGGFYEGAFSCNPIWEPEFKAFPEHPVSNGVKPFQIKDEWYFNMRFRPAFERGTKTVETVDARFVPILVATPPDAVRDGPYVYPKGPYPHIQEAKGEPEAMMWCVEREDGGRAFGFTGGHFHLNWANDDFRKAVLNALLWVTGVEVPEGGVVSNVTEAELYQNLDDKKPAKKTSQITPKVFQRLALKEPPSE